MDKNMLCEALYALPSGVVVRRKKSLAPAIYTLAFGLILLALYFMRLDQISNNLSSSLILLTGGVLLIGLLMMLSRIVDKEGVPVLTKTGKRLRYVERYFPIDERNYVQQLIDQGALRHLLSLSDNSVSGISVAMYYSEDKHIAAMQAYEYISFEYRPITGIKVIEL